MKYLNLIIAISIAIIYNSFSVFSQSLNPTIDRITPPSPSAASLGKFGGIPVGKSTGIPEINIPLYNYDNQTVGLSLAIAFSYHAGGIRVDELPSTVGSGWALNAGGVISRTMRGIYDEMANIGFLNSPGLPQNELEGNSPPDVSLRPFNDMYAFEADSQNDIFTYNFAGKSGKFVLGKNNNILLLNAHSIKIEKFVGPLEGPTSLYKLLSKFIITDEKGFKYKFEDAEITVNHSMPTAAAQYTSSWYLSKIVAPSGKDSIEFEYEDTVFDYLLGKNASLVSTWPGSIGLPSGIPYTISTASQQVKGKRLRAIKFPNNVSVNFSYSLTERIDPKQTLVNQGDYLLKEVLITYESGQRGYKLIHDYSTNRPTLKEIIPFAGSLKKEENGYSFTYSPTMLPNRLSGEQDHWGFYNSNHDENLIPSEIFVVGSNGSHGKYHEFSGGNRDTDYVRCKAGSLTAIHYPTGGRTEFEMEVNEAIDPRLGASITAEKNSYERTDIIHLDCTSNGSSVKDFDFLGDPNSRTVFKVKIQNVSSINCNSTCKVFFEIRDASDVLIDVKSYDPPVGSFQPEHTFENFTLAPGKYFVTTYTQGLSNYNVKADFKWTETRILNPVVSTETLGHRQLYVGGLRIKKISEYSANSTVPSTCKEYQYLLEDGTTSSGTLGFYPTYSNGVCYLQGGNSVYDEVYICTTSNYITRSSSTLYPLIYTNGAPVAYKRVVEKITGRNSTLGKTEYYFKSFDEAPVMILKPFPFVPPEYKEWRNGLLDSLRVYDSNNILVRKEEFVYQDYEDPFWNDPIRFESLRSISIAPVKYLPVPAWQVPRYFKANSFYPIAGRSDLIEKKVYEYSSHGALVTHETKTLHPDHFLVTESLRKNSLGNNLLQKFSYPQDMVTMDLDPTGVYQQMVNSNIIGAVVAEFQINNGNLLSQAKKNYIAPYTNVYAVETVEFKTGNSPSEIRIRNHKFNAKGRPLTVSKERDSKISYLWGYNDQYLVAEINNAESHQVFYTSFEDVEDTNVNSSGGWTGAKCWSGNYVIPLDKRPALGNYVVQYWEQINSGVWTYKSQFILNNIPSQISSSGLIDEVRIYPIGALMSTYTYNPLFGVTSTTDVNGRTTFYEYDDFGRLQFVRDNNKNIVTTYSYNYIKQNLD